MCKHLHLYDIRRQTRRLLCDLESIVGLHFSLEQLGQTQAELDYQGDTLWIAQLPYTKFRDYPASIARRDEELARIRGEVFARRPLTDPLTNLEFLAWCHSALETLQDLAERSDASGLYGGELVEKYLGSILQYFQACLLTDIKRTRKSVAVTA